MARIDDGMGQIDFFANGYWCHHTMKLPPKIDLVAAAHYLLLYSRGCSGV